MCRGQVEILGPDSGLLMEVSGLPEAVSGLPEAVSGLRLGPSEAAEVAPEVAPQCASEVLPRLICSWRNKRSGVQVLRKSYPPSRPSDTIERQAKQRKETLR